MGLRGWAGSGTGGGTLGRPALGARSPREQGRPLGRCGRSQRERERLWTKKAAAVEVGKQRRDSGEGLAARIRRATRRGGGRRRRTGGPWTGKQRSAPGGGAMVSGRRRRLVRRGAREEEEGPGGLAARRTGEDGGNKAGLGRALEAPQGRRGGAAGGRRLGRGSRAQGAWPQVIGGRPARRGEALGSPIQSEGSCGRREAEEARGWMGGSSGPGDGWSRMDQWNWLVCENE